MQQHRKKHTGASGKTKCVYTRSPMLKTHIVPFCFWRRCTQKMNKYKIGSTLQISIKQSIGECMHCITTIELMEFDRHCYLNSGRYALLMLACMYFKPLAVCHLINSRSIQYEIGELTIHLCARYLLTHLVSFFLMLDAPNINCQFVQP